MGEDGGFEGSDALWCSRDNEIHGKQDLETLMVIEWEVCLTIMKEEFGRSVTSENVNIKSNSLPSNKWA